MDSDEHGAVSVGSPSQAAEDGALAHCRDLNFLAQEQDGSHSDHSPHSAQTPETANNKLENILLNCNIFSINDIIPSKSKKQSEHFHILNKKLIVNFNFNLFLISLQMALQSKQEKK